MTVLNYKRNMEFGLKSINMHAKNSGPIAKFTCKMKDDVEYIMREHYPNVSIAKLKQMMDML